MRRGVLLIVGILALQVRAEEGSPWVLVFEDEFDRTEVGPDWFPRHGRAFLREGRLHLEGEGSTLLSTRGFLPDQRIEFEAEANPEAPPCDLSATLCASPVWGWEYLFAFGGQSNQVHQILGGSAPRVDRTPAHVIEPGRRYSIRATKEGRRLTLEVDGVLLLESEDRDPVGGPAFDRAGLVTWGGMRVDHLRVYERRPAAPDSPWILGEFPPLGIEREGRRLTLAPGAPPGVQAAVEAFNARRYAEAVRTLSSLELPSFVGVAALAYAVADPAYEDVEEDRERLLSLAEALVARTGREDARARCLALGAKRFRGVSVSSRDRRAVSLLRAAGEANNPFYWKATLYMARYLRASALEGADARRVAEALEIFRDVRRAWDELPALRELTGERIEWRQDLIRPESDGPAWARYLEECLRRDEAILRWWVDVRQAPDGRLGGGWGDDVEILRGWNSVAVIASPLRPVVEGIARLARGVWEAELVEGYSREIGDVEHSAEPSADALPPLILLQYGSARAVEWNLRSAKTIRERFLARNERGRLQFRSAEFGAEGVNSHPRAGGDTGYHARAMRHFLWLAWYGIGEAREVHADWCRTWREAALGTEGGKPAGFIPASIFFPSGSILPAEGRSWCDPAAHYYGFPGLTLHVEDALLAAAWIGGDRSFLEPVEFHLREASSGPIESFRGDLPCSDGRNLRHLGQHSASAGAIAIHRALADTRAHDALLLRFGSATQRFSVSGDLALLERSLEALVRDLRTGWATRTSEVLQTDRAGLAGAAELLEAYTGALRDFRDGAPPTLAVTWDTPDLEFAALVLEASHERLRVRLHAFGMGSKAFGLRPWRLDFGRYALSEGEILPEATGGGLERVNWRPVREVHHGHRGAPIAISVPSGRDWLVELRLVDLAPVPGSRADLAIEREDVARTRSGLRVRVHNLGDAPARAFELVGVSRTAGGSRGRGESRVRVPGLDPPRAFEPSWAEVELVLPADLLEAGIAFERVVVDPEDLIDEICEENNRVEFGD